VCAQAPRLEKAQNAKVEGSLLVGNDGWEMPQSR